MPQVITREVCDRLTLCDRGNTLLRGCDSDKLLFLATVEPGLHFFAEHLPGNYPAFNTWFARYTDPELLAFVRNRYGGWECVKNNHGLPLDSESCVMPPPSGEPVL
jgi:hypothetical protein